MPEIGRTIGHYQVLEQIGAGGMGVVCRGRDTRLRRDVALKFLPPNTVLSLVSRQRLRKEAYALSRLSHPAVATIFDFISEPEFDCIVMEFVAGESFDKRLARGPMSEAEILPLAIQLADGLASAHAAGVVHRDLKPGNLRLTADGRLKILDFGLAKRVSAESMTTAGVDSQNELAGTFPYIAPEVWGGGPATAASDLFAFGVVLYQMTTGSLLFPELTGAAVAHATLKLEPVSIRSRNPALSPGFAAVVERCLQKQPSRRFPSAMALQEALEALRSTPPGSIRLPKPLFEKSSRVALGAAGVVVLALAAFGAWRVWGPHGRRFDSLAVLPLANLSGDSAQEYLVDGMTDQLTSRLSEVPGVRVISRHSMMRFKGSTESPRDIARELGVDCLVQGSVKRTASGVGISAKIIDGGSGRSVWSGHVEGGRNEAESLVESVALGIAPNLETGSQVPKARPPVNPAAYNLFMQGRLYLDRRDAGSIRRAAGYFESAIGVDSLYAPAWAGLANARSALAFSGTTWPTEAYPVAKRAALRALELDPQLADGHIALANVLQNYEWDWDGAARSFRHGIELNENDAIAHHWYANELALRGDFDGALAENALARKLDPYSLPVRVGAGAILYFARRDSAALAAYLLAAELDSTSGLVQRAMAAVYDRLGRQEEAARALGRWLETEQPGASVAVSRAYAAGGLPGVLRFFIAAMTRRREAGQYEPATHVAELYSRLGEREQAFHWLAIALRERDTELNRLKVDPLFDPLRGDPRFGELLDKVGLGRAIAARP